MRIVSGVLAGTSHFQQLDNAIRMIAPVDSSCRKFWRGGTMKHLHRSVKQHTD